ncbi:hypothetical protein ACES2L_15080 [Bdellovibrio bacteriovorus]
MKTAIIITAAASMLIFSSSFANEMKGMGKDMKEMSKEDRQKMADMHMKMADCLKSTKPMNECKNEMMKSCEGMGKESCAMMGHHKGMKDHHMMGDHGKKTSKDSTTKQPETKE